MLQSSKKRITLNNWLFSTWWGSKKAWLYQKEMTEAGRFGESETQHLWKPMQRCAGLRWVYSQGGLGGGNSRWETQRGIWEKVLNQGHPLNQKDDSEADSPGVFPEAQKLLLAFFSKRSGRGRPSECGRLRTARGVNGTTEPSKANCWAILPFLRSPCLLPPESLWARTAATRKRVGTSDSFMPNMRLRMTLGHRSPEFVNWNALDQSPGRHCYVILVSVQSAHTKAAKNPHSKSPTHHCPHP